MKSMDYQGYLLHTCPQFCYYAQTNASKEKINTVAPMNKLPLLLALYFVLTFQLLQEAPTYAMDQRNKPQSTVSNQPMERGNWLSRLRYRKTLSIYSQKIRGREISYAELQDYLRKGGEYDPVVRARWMENYYRDQENTQTDENRAEAWREIGERIARLKK